MVQRVRSMVITGNGTNCEREMAHACRLAGSEEVDIVHISDLLSGEKRLDDYHFLNLPGGFVDGDDLGSAKANANRLLHVRIRGTEERLYDALLRFIAEGKLILGVCNGFQLMVKLGLLPGFDGDYRTQTVTLTYNDSGKFEDRWVYLKPDPSSPCVFTRGLEEIYLPVRHGEGKLVPRDEGILRRLHEQKQVVLQYCDETFQHSEMIYPRNPNGSVDAVAGLCNETGRLFGLMPHPEAYLHATNHPRWTREKLPEEGQGLRIFRNAVTFLRREL